MTIINTWYAVVEGVPFFVVAYWPAMVDCIELSASDCFMMVPLS